MRGINRCGVIVSSALSLACGPDISSAGSELTETGGGTHEEIPDIPAATESSTDEGDTDAPPTDDCDPDDVMEGFIAVATPDELAQLSGVCGIDGSLTVRDSDQITSLDPLSSLQWVTGQLVLSELSALESLDGLAALRETTGLRLRSLPGLSDLSGLDAFEASAAVALWDLPTLDGLFAPVTIGHTFTSAATLRFSVGSIADLQSLDQLPELELIPGDAPFDTMIVDIESSPQLVDLIGVEAVLTEDPADVELWLRDLPIVDLTGLEGQTVLAGLELRSMPALTSFAGSGDLLELGELLVSGATSLAAFADFPALEHVGHIELGNYCINESGGFDDNPLLVDLSGLGGVAVIDLLTVSGLSRFDAFAGLSAEVQLADAQVRWNSSLAPATIDAFLLDHELELPQPGNDNCGNLDQEPCPPCPGD